MGDQDSEKRMVASIIKSIIVSVKGGLPFHKLDGDYREQNGQRIPYSKFGFKSLEDFLRSISEVKLSREGGSIMLTVADPKMDHITSLLNRQKPQRKRIRPQKRGSYGRPGGRGCSRGGGFSIRPVPSTYRRAMVPQSFRVEPRALPVNNTYYRDRAETRAPPPPGINGRERGQGEGPKSEHSNFYSRRPPVTSDQNQTRVGFQPAQLAYSSTHSIRQGKGFVEYVPLDDPPPKIQETTQKASQNGDNKTGVDKSDNNNTLEQESTTKPKSPLIESYENFLRRLEQEKLCQIEEEKLRRREEEKLRRQEEEELRQLEQKRLHQLEQEKEDAKKRDTAEPKVSLTNGRGSLPRSTQDSYSGGRGRAGRSLVDQLSRVTLGNGFDALSESHDTTSVPARELLNGRKLNFSFNGLHEEHDPTNRTVDWNGGLTVTISNDFVGDEDDDEDWLDYDEDEQDEDSYVAYHKLVLRPKFRNHQLIGDDYLLTFANHIDEPCQEVGGRLSQCGLCISGQTILMCLNDVYNTDTLSDRVILLVGAVDILQGIDLSTLKLQLISLLTALMEKSIKHVYVCTIPPMVNLSEAASYVRARFNKYIRSLESDTMHVIDLETAPFVDDDNQLCPSYFEKGDIQTVNPSSVSVRLCMWNNQGLEAVRTLIQKCLGQ